MKWCVFAVASLLPALAQQSVQTRTYDGMGNILPSTAYSSTQSGKTGTRTEQRMSANGRMVPVESTEERVVSDDGRTRIVERTVRRFDMNGNPGPSEKVQVEERKAADGSLTVRTSTWRGDINGGMALAERSVKESRKSGSTETVNETVERPSINGSIDVAERRATTISSTSPDESVRNTVLYQRTPSGGFYEAGKEVAQTRKTKAGLVENVATYEGGMGGFRLVDQKVKRTVKAADGSEETVVDIYTTNAPGIVNSSADQKPMLREQQVITRTVAGGGVSETVDVRRPTINDPSRLGAPARISETVCKGKCP